MIAIYSNNSSTDNYINQLNFYQPYRVYQSLDDYLNSDSQIKIAFINHRARIYEDSTIIDVTECFFQEIDKLKAHSDLLIAFDNELHPYHCNLFQQHQQTNVCWVIPGHVNDQQLVDSNNVIQWNAHFIQFLLEYGPVSDALNELDHRSSKPMYFDALLGQTRCHRDFIYQAIHSHNLQNKILTTYMNYITPVDCPFHTMLKSTLEWEPDIENFNETVTLSTHYVQYRGHNIALSRIVPVGIYDRTAYSIVAETGFDNRYSFFTEKTAKPMMARRLFVVFSGYKFLQNLRNLGFQTFDNVIDESYDLIYNNQDRWSAAFDQVQRLCEMDQQEVFEKIAPAVAHNYRLLVNTDWTQHMLDQVQQKLNQQLASHV